jgi:hypothetical protein
MLEVWNMADDDIFFLKRARQLSYAAELEPKLRAAQPRR